MTSTDGRFVVPQRRVEVSATGHGQGARGVVEAVEVEVEVGKLECRRFISAIC